ncbi:hypothetical protein Raf01_09740 [Rugosimonospora africana]|uniref:Uncharacterized protein n=1 Tax=Rugosimonospora africana TaxID=556532 RepID=A0A8J3QNL9_9ACTN|nr:hypothetical protein Raf01_09740 [Rugosimonospora africana]
MLATLVGTAVGGFAAAQPAAAGHSADYATTISQRYTDSLDAHASLTPGTEIPLGSWRDADGKHHMSRVYATYDLSGFAGKEVFTANLYAHEEEVTDCAERDIEVWITSPVSDPTWADPPAEQTLIGAVTGSGSCPGLLSRDLTAAVQQALNAGQTKLGVELRIPADREGDTARGRWLNVQYGVRLTIDYNTPPEVPTQLSAGRQQCGTQAPYPYLATPQPTLAARFDDADPNDKLTGSFAIWPVGDPDDRTTINTIGHIPSGAASFVTVPAGVITEDGTYGWQSRLNDDTDTSDWSQTCYFTADLTPPANPPGVTSSNYPQGGFIDGGTPGHFTFTANGVDDVIGYQYSWDNYPGVPLSCSPTASDPSSTSGIVAAEGLGGSAVVDLSPPEAGPNELYVRSLDRACNISDLTRYDVQVRDTSPTVLAYSQPVLGKPFTLTVKPNPAVAPIVSYRYQVNSDDPQTVAAKDDGSASITFTPSCFCGVLSVQVSSISANGWVSPPGRYYHDILNVPVVSSDIYPDYLATWQPGGGVGITGHFTFASPVAGTVAYQYSIDWGDTQTVAAVPDGTATIEWTPDTSGPHEIDLWAVDANGNTISEQGTYDVYVTDPS